MFAFNDQTKAELINNGLSMLELGRMGAEEYEGRVNSGRQEEARQLLGEANALSSRQVNLLRAWQAELAPLPRGFAADRNRQRQNLTVVAINKALEDGSVTSSKASWPA